MLTSWNFSSIALICTTHMQDIRSPYITSSSRIAESQIPKFSGRTGSPSSNHFKLSITEQIDLSGWKRTAARFRIAICSQRCPFIVMRATYCGRINCTYLFNLCILTIRPHIELRTQFSLIRIGCLILQMEFFAIIEIIIASGIGF